ncbi:iron-containing alcohol dehydrogenase [Nigerium massiliense]|uniref:iron-containing alcohol dehydrogenase n=1 Tax=Nigerium massiliense TaxID=1522317 RepID=UPI00058BC62F|nr:iron-containing alcohol dehydrogenase [Nigerium massiliense]
MNGHGDHARKGRGSAIALIGLSGSGKSTVGPMLAAKLGLPHHDVDVEVERREGRTIREIFDADGEPAFRALERDATIDLLQTPGVLSLGGGGPLTPQVADALRGHPVVWLRVAPAVAAARIGHDENRPLLAGRDAALRLRSMLSQRAGTYAALASLAVDTDRAGVDAVVDSIAAHVADFTPDAFGGEVIPVNAEKPYEVRVGRGVSFELGRALGRRERVALLHPAPLAEAAGLLVETTDADVTLIEVPDGEDAKRAAVLDAVWHRLDEAGFTRADAVVGLGGGSTTDLAGFVAATWLRGLDFVSIPTTLLAMVDTAIGGKTGINVGRTKNAVGAFWEPIAVLCDTDHLTGDPDALRGGLAEMAKHGLVADPPTLELLETRTAAMFDPARPELAEGIARSIQVKTAIASADLREATSVGTDVGREVLNYGHTLGLAVERHSGWGHGQAVSVGLLYAAVLSHRLGHAGAALVGRHRRLLERLGLPTDYDRAAWPELRRLMNRDKKVRASALRFVLLDDVARPRIEVAPDEDDLRDSYEEIAR